MADIDAAQNPVNGDRLAWNAPRVVQMTPARDIETGILNGPEILILLS